MFTIGFDQDSLSQIAQLYGFHALLTDAMREAMEQGGTILVEAIRADMHWQDGSDGSGPLGQSIVPVLESPYELQVGSDLPHARRRNWGFVGADSLGRVYNDAGAYFMEHGLEASKGQIEQLFYNAVFNSLGRMGGY